MRHSFRAYGIFLAAGIVAACGSVSGNDSSFWRPSQNLGGPGAGAAQGFGGSGTGGGGAGTGGSSTGGSSTGGSSTGGSSTGGSSTGGSSTGGSSTGGSSTGGSSTGGSGTGGGGGGPTMCQFTFSFTTQDNGGRFSPKDVEATWIEGPNNQFIKTLEKHAFVRQFYLSQWNQSSGGNTVDAVTSATECCQPQTHNVKWNCTDISGNPVPAGTYHIYFEFTEDDHAGPVGHVDFQVGKSQNLNPPDQQYFKNMKLTMK